MKSFIYILPLICALLVPGTIEAKKKKYPNGDYYEGEWKKGAPHGIGIMKYAKGGVYEGNWEFGKRNGQGTMKYANGNVYEGNWLLGEMNGQGIMVYSFGLGTYEGNWMLGKRKGIGIMKFSDGRTYNGHWDMDHFYGQGKMTYENGKFEEGEWKYGILIDGTADVNLRHDGKYHIEEYFKGEVKNGEYYNGEILGTYKNTYYDGILKNGKIYNGFNKKETTFGPAQIFYSEGIQTKANIKSADGWVYDGEIKDDIPYGDGVIVKDKYKIKTVYASNKYNGTLYFEDGTQKTEEIPSPTDSTAFKNWIVSAFKEIDRVNRLRKIQYERELKEKIENAEAKMKAREAELNRSKMTDQIAYYIWEATDIRSVYENNPARFRTLTQNKYVIIGGTIAEIDESRNVEYSQLWQDWVEYKYYTIRLSGGVYFESRDAEFVSNLNRGQELLFVCSYTDKQSFNRPLFDLRMYDGSTQGIIKLMVEDGISLSKLVKR